MRCGLQSGEAKSRPRKWETAGSGVCLSVSDITGIQGGLRQIGVHHASYDISTINCQTSFCALKVAATHVKDGDTTMFYERSGKESDAGQVTAADL